MMDVPQGKRSPLCFQCQKRCGTRTPQAVFSRNASRNYSSPHSSRLSLCPFGVLVVGREMSGQPPLAGSIAEHFGVSEWPFLRSPGRGELLILPLARGCLATATLHPLQLGVQGASGCRVVIKSSWTFGQQGKHLLPLLSFGSKAKGKKPGAALHLPSLGLISCLLGNVLTAGLAKGAASCRTPVRRTREHFVLVRLDRKNTCKELCAFPSLLSSVRNGMCWTSAPGALEAEPPTPLHSLCAQLWGAEEPHSLFARTEGNAAPYLHWGSLEPCAGFPFPLCKVNRSWHLTMSNILQRRDSGSAQQHSSCNKLCDCIPSAGAVAHGAVSPASPA